MKRARNASGFVLPGAKLETPSSVAAGHVSAAGLADPLGFVEARVAARRGMGRERRQQALDGRASAVRASGGILGLLPAAQYDLFKLGPAIEALVFEDWHIYCHSSGGRTSIQFPLCVWPSRQEMVRAHPQLLMLPKLSVSFVQPTMPSCVLTSTHQTPQRSVSLTG